MTEVDQRQTVYLIDDDDAVRDSMGMLLESNGITYLSYNSAIDFLNHYDTDMRGCLVLDIRMPEMDGLELQARLNDLNSNLPIIFMTGHGDVPMAVEAMRRGALDFMRKPVDELNLLKRIDQALNYENEARQQVKKINEIIQKFNSLTQREKEIFHRVANGQANKAIAIELEISERTVEVHRSQAMKKLSVTTLAQLVRVSILLEQAASSPKIQS